MLTPRFARLLPLMCLSLAACGRCGGDASAPERSESPRLALVQHVPGDTHAIAHTGDLSIALAGYLGARDELEGITSDLGLLETDLTNTLGIDLRRAETLRDVGIDPERGALAFTLDDEPVVLLAASDSERLQQRMSEVLSAQPIALDATPERRALGDAELVLFRRQGAETVIAAVLVRDDHVALWPSEPADAEAAATALLSVTPDTSLATSETFRALWSQRSESTPSCAWLSEQAADASGGPAVALREAGATFAELAGVQAQGLLACFRLDDSGVGSVLTLGTSGNPVADMQVPSAPPGFSNLFNEDSQGVVRWTLPPTVFLDVVNRASGEELAATVAPYEQDLGISFETVVSQAFGTRGALLLTRTRAFTLRRAINSGAPGDWAAGLGIVGVVEVQQRDLTERLLRSVVSNMGEGATIFEEGELIVVEFNNAESDIGNLVLDEGHLYVLPARERSRYVEQIESGEGATLDALRGDDAQVLVTAGSATGLYLDLTKIVDGPIGQIGLARLPDEAKRAAARFDYAVLDVSFSDSEMRVSLDLRFPLAESP